MGTAAFRGLGTGTHPAAPSGTLVAAMAIAAIAIVALSRTRTQANVQQSIHPTARLMRAIPAVTVALILIANGVQSWTLSAIHDHL